MIPLDANGHAWRDCLCDVLAESHDYDDAQVTLLFADSREWATRQGIPVDPHRDYARQYLASRDVSEPAIPEHVRLYCAHLKGLPLDIPKPAAHEQRTGSQPARKTSAPRAVPQKPPYHRRTATR